MPVHKFVPGPRPSRVGPAPDGSPQPRGTTRMMKQIGTVLGGSTPRADRHPVRRGSRLAGACEGVFWRRTDRQEVRRIVLAAKRYELAGRQRGHRNGPLGHVGLEVLDLLANLVSYRSGRLEPSIAYLMGKLKRSKDAVVRALAALREHGFLDWLRRHEAVELVEGAGAAGAPGEQRLPAEPARAGRAAPGAPVHRAAAARRRGAGARGPRRLARRAEGEPAAVRAAVRGDRGRPLGAAPRRARPYRAGARVRQAGRNPNSALTKVQRGG